MVDTVRLPYSHIATRSYVFVPLRWTINWRGAWLASNMQRINRTHGASTSDIVLAAIVKYLYARPPSGDYTNQNSSVV